MRVIASLLLILPAAAGAQAVPAPTYNSSNSPNAVSVRATGIFPLDSGGNDASDTTNHAVRVTCASGCSGGVSVPAVIYSGQQATTTSAAALPSQALANGYVITALPANTGTVYIGPAGVTASTGYPLVAGQSISYQVTNASAIYIVDATSGDKIAFTGN